MWVMSTLRLERPVRYEVWIGALTIATIHFAGSRAVLTTRGCSDAFATMSDALTELHRRLNAPPPDGAKVGRST